jgi:hypothetical protein
MGLYLRLHKYIKSIHKKSYAHCGRYICYKPRNNILITICKNFNTQNLRSFKKRRFLKCALFVNSTKPISYVVLKILCRLQYTLVINISKNVACCEIYTLKSDRCKKANVKFNKKDIRGGCGKQNLRKPAA